MAQQQTTNSENKKKNDGKSLSGYGKIFLMAAVLLVQGGAAYAVINSYYGEIYQWMGQWDSEEHIYRTFESLIINPAQSNGQRYLVLSMVVEVNSEADAALLEAQRARIVDKVNLILSERTTEELSDIKERESIKQEIGVVINKIVGKKAVRNLFFTKYVLQ